MAMTMVAQVEVAPPTQTLTSTSPTILSHRQQYKLKYDLLVTLLHNPCSAAVQTLSSLSVNAEITESSKATPQY
jgi:hypothetical protein